MVIGCVQLTDVSDTVASIRINEIRDKNFCVGFLYGVYSSGERHRIDSNF